MSATDDPPVFFPPGVQSFAGFWKRFAAGLIDVFINLLIGVIVGGTVGFLMGASGYEIEAIEALANVA